MHDILLISQKEIVSALNANVNVQSAVVGIYDEVPEATSAPYIAIADVSAALVTTVNCNSYNVTGVIHLHEDYNGKESSLALSGHIIDALQSTSSSDGKFNIIVSDVQISIRNTNIKHNIMTTEFIIELYVDRLGVI